MERPFNHEIEILGIQLSVSGNYYPSDHSEFFHEPDEPSIVEMERISVSGSDVNIKDLIDADMLERIEHQIDRIESNQ